MLPANQLITPPKEKDKTFKIYDNIVLPSEVYRDMLKESRKKKLTVFDCLERLVIAGDINTLNTYIQQGGSLNVAKTAGKHGKSLINVALACKAPDEMVHFLLDQPTIDLWVQDNMDETPIFSAIRRPVHTDKLLSKQEKKALNAEAKKKKNEIISKILQKGVDLTVKNQSGNTPLIAAVNLGDTPVFNLIMNQASKVANYPFFAKNKEGDSALHYAVRNQKAGFTAALLDKITPETADILEETSSQGHYLLSQAAQHHNLSLFNKILAAYERLNKTPSRDCVNTSLASCCYPWTSNRAPIKKAEEEDSIEIATKLLQKGANINVSSQTRKTPILLAISSKILTLALFLLNYNAQTINVDMQDDSGWNALSHLFKVLKESSIEYFEQHKKTFHSIVKELLQRMSEEEIRYAAAQINFPIDILRGQNIQTIYTELRRPKVDLQSTHRTSVHQSTAKSASVLKLRYTSLAVSTKQAIIAYFSQTWLSKNEERAYLANLKRSIEKPIEGDTGDVLRGLLTKKFEWIQSNIQKRRLLLETHKGFLEQFVTLRALTPSIAEDPNNEMANQYFTILHLIDQTNWIKTSCQHFLRVAFMESFDWQEPTAKLSVPQLLMLVWTAIEDPRHHLTEEQKKSIKTQLGIAMIDIAHNGGIFQISCLPGIFNAIVDAVARTGLIPGVYVLSEPSEAALVKQRLKETLSLQSHFDSLTPDNQIKWFENQAVFEEAKIKIKTQYQEFLDFGGNQTFTFFERAELDAFESEWLVSWDNWVAAHAHQKPSLESLIVSELKGMSEAERISCVRGKRKALHTTTESEEDDVQHVAKFMAVEMEDGPAEMEVDKDPLSILADSIFARHASLLVNQFDKKAIQEKVLGNVILVDLCDYRSQQSNILANPTNWVKEHWNTYYMQLTDSDLKSLLTQLGVNATGDKNRDLLAFAQHDSKRVLKQLGLSDTIETGKAILEGYQEWLDIISEQIASATPVSSPG